MSATSNAATVLAFAAIYIIWGSTYFAIKVGIDTVPPFLFAGFRFLLAGLPVLVWARFRGAPAPTPAQWRGAALTGVLLLVGGNGLVTVGEQWVPSGLAAVIIATVPLWIAVLDRVFYRGPALTRPVLVGLALGLAGVALLVDPLGSGRLVHPGGVVLLVGAALSWSVGTLHSRRAALPASPLLATGMQMAAGGAALVLGGTLAGEWGRLDVAAITPGSWIAFAYLVVFGSVVAYSAYVWLLRTRSASAVATYAFVNPVVAVLLGWLVGGETMNPRMLAATMGICSGVVLIWGVRGRKRPRAGAPRPQWPTPPAAAPARPGR